MSEKNQPEWGGKFLNESDLKSVKFDDIQAVALMEIAYQLSEIRELLGMVIDGEPHCVHVKVGREPHD